VSLQGELDIARPGDRLRARHHHDDDDDRERRGHHDRTTTMTATAMTTVEL